MICPICSSSINDDLKFCEKCGKEIPRCPTCGNVLSKKKKFCGYDGTAIPESILTLFQEDATGLMNKDLKASEEIHEAVAGNSNQNCSAEGKRAKNGTSHSQPIERADQSEEKAKPKSRIRYCGKCGRPCDDGQSVCSMCRQLNTVRRSELAVGDKPKKKNGMKYTLITLAAIFCLLVGFVASYYFINREIPFVSQIKGISVTENMDRSTQDDKTINNNDSTEEIEENNEKADDSDDDTQEYNKESETNVTDTPSDETYSESDDNSNASEAALPVETPATNLFSSGAAQDIAGQVILGASINEATTGGWVNQWIRLYYYGGTDEQSQAAIQRTRGIPLETWLRDYATYDRARDAGWGDAWLTLTAGLTDGNTAGITGQANIYDKFLEFVNNCDTRYFTRSDLEGLDASMAILARNAPYAHAGRKFTTDTIRSFFEQFSWYHPLIEADAFKETMLNDYETANKNLVVDYEKEKGYK